MLVRLAVIGRVEVYHAVDVVHVYPPRCHVGGYHDPGLPRAELVHRPVTLLLLHAAVEGGEREVHLAHLVAEPVDPCPGSAEDDAAPANLRDVRGQFGLAPGVDLPEEVLHAVHAHLLGPYPDSERVMLV